MVEGEVARVLLVDDQQMVREGLIIFLGTQAGITIVGEACNGKEALRLVEEQHPNVVLMDLLMPEMDGLAAIAAIKAKHPETQIVVITGCSHEEEALAAIQAGAIGYHLKELNPFDLVRTIRAAARGEAYQPAGGDDR
jgi:DNA-binding NarL/FixJ family response regulator